ncbi:MAG: 4Fe-4S binding protein [Tissierellia bacterium]|nr:4Fe-4S binding protein [Tissierellia bacterium]
MENKKELILNKEWCKGCWICVEFCPKQVLDMKDGKCQIVNLEDCIYCQLCEIRCPDNAIYIKTVGGNDHD